MRFYRWALMLGSSTALAACGHSRVPAAAPQAYAPQALPFHQYTLDVPADVDTEQGLKLMAFGGHNWRVVPAASAKEVRRGVQKRAQELNRLRQDASNAANGFKLSLYRVVDGGKNRWGVLGRHPVNLRPAAPDTTYADWYVYQPQHRYMLHGQLAARPDSSDAVTAAQQFLQYIEPLSPAHINDGNAMVVGPLVWLNPEGEQPYIRYRLDSRSQRLNIELDVGPAGPNQASLNQLKQERIQDRLRQGGSRSRVLVKRLSTVAGLEGKEDCIRIEAVPAPILWCSWITAGKEQDRGRPSIDLTLQYSTDTEAGIDEGMAAWRQLLGSLRRRSG